MQHYNQYYKNQPLHHHLQDLTYGGVTAMDVPGQEKDLDEPDRVRPQQRGNDERSIGQGKKIFCDLIFYSIFRSP